MPRFQYRGHESARQQQHTHNDYYNLWKKGQKKCAVLPFQNKIKSEVENKTE